MASISVKDVGIVFPIYDARGRSMKSRIFDLVRRPRPESSSITLITALNGVSVDLREGDRLAIIGRNGSGKTTLLRVLAGIYEPTSGSVTIDGAVASMTDLTMGMDWDATGEENIVIRGILLGLTRREATALIEPVREFTELGDRLQLPVRTYSTGMLLRLAFAISTSIKPDILVMDEMIGAGDAQFLQKARRRIRDLIGVSSILAISSHNLEMIREFCTSGILLSEGRVVARGPVDEVVARYKDSQWREHSHSEA
jgi:ABC-type polysaccharide/polyol phosphate transport system ATPase subunit